MVLERAQSDRLWANKNHIGIRTEFDEKGAFTWQ
jgi:hypothetical protein